MGQRGEALAAVPPGIGLEDLVTAGVEATVAAGGSLIETRTASVTTMRNSSG
jgi:hypothetical protein